MRWLFVALSLAACHAPTGEFRCASSAACVHLGSQGTCEPTGYCSFADSTCSTRRRYVAETSPALSSACVGEPTDGGISVGPIEGHGGAILANTFVTRTATVPIPVDTVAGDLMWIVLAVTPAVDPVVPDGWVLRRSESDCDTGKVYFYYGFRTANEPPSTVVTFSTNVELSMVVASYANVHPTLPIDIDSTSRYCQNGWTDAVAPSINAHAGDRLVAMFTSAAGTSDTWSTPTAMNPVADTGRIGVFDEIITVDGPTGDKTSNVYNHTNGPQGSLEMVALRLAGSL